MGHPKALAKRDIIGKIIGEELRVPIMSDQMNAMFNHTEVFITLLGGLGTLIIIISAATAEQLIDQLQSFIPVIDPSMSRINWSNTENHKKLKLDLSLRL